ncbi:MAG: benzoate/H(+) symporter BenE family transporter [Hyphomicrobiaceae bacterium]|nr:benzoate/H(+) symporter BenE family transporter [Hyphomicrobiaceae bacterium]
MRLSVITAAVVAALVGIAGALAVVLEAAKALGATPAETTSWVTALCLSMALTSGFLSLRHRMPIITAWSTPGAAVIAATAGTMQLDAAVGGFLLAGALLTATGLVKPLETAVRRLPVGVAAGMLAGVLIRFVLQMVEAVPEAPLLVLPLVAVFAVARLRSPGAAMLLVIIAGLSLATGLGLVLSWPPLTLSSLTVVTPRFDAAALVGLGVPLYLVTMASQNLPGAAVLKASGYEPPLRSSLLVTGFASMLIAPLGAHPINLAAITAAICTGPDAHPDPAKRWWTGIAYLAVYTGLAAAGASLVALFAVLPAALVKVIAGLGLIGALTGALGSAVAEERHRFAAVVTFAVTASGITVLGVGAAFWGLVAGLAVLGLDRLTATAKA